ncbi:MAG: TIGR03546 family protein [Elusimicrobiota bacterium]
MFWLKLLKRIITILQSEISPSQVAWGFALGSIMGLTPFSALHNYFVFVLILMLNVNMSSATLAVIVFSFIGMLMDPLAHKIGYYLLVTNQSLNSTWVSLYNMPVVPFTRFNNTVVLGSLVISLILFLPVYFAAKKFIVYYRAHFKDKVAKWKIMKLFKVSNIAGTSYQKFN